ALYFALASRRHPSCAVSPLPLHCFPTRRSSDLIVGAGATGESGMDAGNMIKPMLARGELRMVGATTLDEYREHIETDAALERRRSEEHTSELQSRFDLVCRLRLETRTSSQSRPA